jgi:hypothetical protein
MITYKNCCDKYEGHRWVFQLEQGMTFRNKESLRYFQQEQKTPLMQLTI